MKFTTTLLVASATLAAANHHHHRHLHEKRANQVQARGEPNVVYVLNGNKISADECREGLKNGTLTFGAEGGEVPPEEPAHKDAPPPPPPPPPQPQAPQAANYDDNGAKGVDRDYDNSVSCDQFPSAYGPVAIEYLGLNGWTGVQSPGYSGANGYNNIVTAIKGGACNEGDFCSYACPPGYQKSQWPELQGVTGQSVGGLQCKGGKLTLTRPSVKQLCTKGTSKISVKIVNKLPGGGAAVCRTDYPGTESETIPIDTKAGSTYELACPDGDEYYRKNGAPTSAQYYVNNHNVAVADACQWGDGSKPVGNYAPLNIGVGYSAGKGWISIFQNAPTTTAKLDFSVEIQGDDIIGKCRYQNGKYCSGDNYSNCNDSQGCTVTVNSGEASFVFS